MYSLDAEILRPLTSPRFVAALMLFLYHCPGTSAFGARYALGHAGVGFFFVLSGFSLIYTYYRDFETDVVWARVRNFYAARIVRIYPPYVLSALIALAVLMFFGNVRWNMSPVPVRELAFAAQIILIQSLTPSEQIYLGINSPAWSLSLEALFYAAFPFVAHFCLRHFSLCHHRNTWYRIRDNLGHPHGTFSCSTSHHVWGAFIFPPVRLVDFTIGCWSPSCISLGSAAPATANGRRSWN